MFFFGIGNGWRKRYSPLSFWLIKLDRIGALRLCDLASFIGLCCGPSLDFARLSFFGEHPLFPCLGLDLLVTLHLTYLGLCSLYLLCPLGN